MSTTVDQRVVEMRFDNAQFERNVSTSMSTLDKLKQSLHLTGASKGLESINAAAKNNNLSVLGNAAETVGAKFSAMQVVGVTALANIANQAVNTGKQLLNSLTVAPVKDGFSEYEMTLNAIQTTMAGTGKTAKEVEQQLKKLDEYADKTVYSTSDMLNNLPKFTNAGVELEKATTAMIGIANATALAGGDAGKASIAFYNLGQAIGTGWLTRMDYNSINNAGIATMEWKEQMIDAAIAAGTLTKAGDDLYEAGGKTFTMQQLFIDGLQHQWATTEVMMKVFGDYGDETTEIGKKAQSAAQDIKTFSQMMESLKATAGTGWKDTWQLVFGDLDEAKVLWTGLSNVVSNIITGMADFRNELLGAVMDSPFASIVDKMENVSKATEKVVDSTEKYAKIVEKVMGGEYGNGEDRWRKLCDEGYNWAKVQNIINEQTGSSVRHNEELWAVQEDLKTTRATTIEQLAKMSEAQLRSLGFTTEEIQSLKDLKKAAEEAGYTVEEVIENPSLLSGRQLLLDGFKNLGTVISDTYKIAKTAWQEFFPPKTVEERAEKIYNLIAAFRKFTEGIKLFQENGKDLSTTGSRLLRTFKGLAAAVDIVTMVIGGPLKIVFDTIVQLLDEFNIDILKHTANIGDAIVALRDWIDEHNIFVHGIKVVVDILKEAGNAVSEWAKGLEGASPKEVAEAIISGLGNAFKYIGTLLDQLRTFITEKATSIGGYLVEGLEGGIWDKITYIWDVIKELANNVITKFCEITGIESPSKVFYVLGGFLVLGLLGGIKAYAPDVWEYIQTFAESCISIFDGINFGAIFTALMSGGAMYSLIKIAQGFHNLTKPLDGLSEMMESFGDAAKIASKGVKVFLKGVGKLAKGLGFKFMGEGVFKMALAIGVLAGSVALLAYLNSKGLLWEAMTAVLMLTSIIVVLMLLVDKMNNAESLKDAAKDALSSSALISIAIALIGIAAALKIMGTMDADQAGTALACLAVILTGIGLLIKTTGKYVSGKTAQNFDQIGKMVRKMAVTILLLVGIMKLASMLTPGEIAKGGLVITGLGIAIVAMVAVLAKINDVFEKKFNYDKLGSGVFKISLAIGLLVGVMKLAAGLTPHEIIQGGIIVTVLGGAIIGMIAALAAINNKIGGFQVEKLGGTLFKISMAILLLVMTMKIAGDMDWREALQGGIIVALLAGGVIGMIAALATINKKIGGFSVDKLGATLFGIGAAMLMLSLTMKILAGMEWGELAKGAVGVTFLGLIVFGLITATNFVTTKDLAKLGITMLAISLAVGILAGIAAMLGLLDIGQLTKGVIAVSILSLMMGVLISATRGATKCVGNIVALTIAIGVLGLIMWGLSKLPVESAVPNTLALGALVLAMSGVLFILSKINTKGLIKAVGNLLAMAVPLAAFVGVLALMDKLDNAQTNAIALGLFTAAMIGVLFILSKINAGSAVYGALALTSAALPLIAFVGVLAVMSNIKNAEKNAVTLGLFTAAMTIVLAGLAAIGNFATSAVFGVLALTSLALPMVAFIGLFALMENLQKARENAFTLGLFTAAMSVVLLLLCGVGALAMVALPGVLCLLLMAVPMVAFVGILALMEKLDNAQTNAELLINLMTTMTDLLIKLAPVAVLALVGVVAMAALTLLIGAIAVFAVGVGALFEKFPKLEEFLYKGLPILEEIAHSIGKFAGNLIGGFAEGVTASLPTVGESLSSFMTKAEGFFDGLKTIGGSADTYTAGAKAVAAAVLCLVGADLLAGIASWIQNGSSFADLGADLAGFMSKAKDFFAGLENIDADTLASAKMVAEMVLALTAAQVLDGIAGWLLGGQDISDFGSKLESFGEAMVGFSNKVSEGINVEAVQAAATAGDIMIALTKSLPKTDGLLQWIMGEQNLETFGNQLASFGEAIVGFSDKVSEGVNIEAVQAAATAGDIMVALTKSLPKTDGLLQWIMGEQNLETFGGQLTAFGEAIVGFSDKVSEGIDTNAVSAAASAGEIMVALAKELPSTGGLLQWIMGEQNLETFGNQLASFGEGIKGFANEVSGLDASGIDTAISAANKLVSLDNTIVDGTFNSGVGNPDIVDLAQVGAKFGKEMADFAKKVGESDFTKVSVAISRAKSFKGLCDETVGLDTSGVTTLNDAVDKFADMDVDGFTTTFDEDLATYTSRVGQLTSMITKLVSLDTSGVSGFKTAINTLAQTGVSDFIKAFSDADTKLITTGEAMMQSLIDGLEKKKKPLTTKIAELVKAAYDEIDKLTDDFRKMGSKLMNKLIDGLEEKDGPVKTACTSGLGDGVEAIRDYYRKFYNAGSYLVDGLVAGIDANDYKVAAQASAMATAAKLAAEEALGIASPSKVFYKIGDYAGMGFTNALGDYISASHNAGAEMAESARKGLSGAISAVTDLINGNVDMTPTIRPVLDLSAVESGVGAIDGMFNRNAYIGASGNLRAISSMMSQNGQNGMNEVVSAINKLSKNLGNVGNTTYHVNGVTYDDGSNISNAVQTLVRAAKVERRI